MKDVLDKLTTCKKEKLGAFDFIDTEGIEKISVYFQCKQFQQGEVLWEEGSPCEYLAFIVSGNVEVKKKTELKGNQVILGIYGKGSYVGALCILDASPRAITAEARDDVDIVLITPDNFEKLMKKYPELGALIMKGMLLSVSKRLISSFDRLVAIF